MRHGCSVAYSFRRLTVNKDQSLYFSKEFWLQELICTPTRPAASCHDAGVRSWYSRILSSGPAVNALRTHVFVYVCMCVCACMCTCTCTRLHTICHDAGVRSWYSRILSSGPAVNALRIPVFVFVRMCVCACMDICTCTPYRPCALISSCLSVCVFLCFCGYLHMRVTTYDLLTESAHRLHVRLHVKHMHSFRGSTHRLL